MYFGVPGAEASVIGPAAVRVFVVESSCSGIPTLLTVTTLSVKPWQVELGWRMFICQYTKPVIVPTAGFIPVTALVALPKGEAVPRGVTCTLEVDGRVTAGCCWPIMVAEVATTIIDSMVSSQISASPVFALMWLLLFFCHTLEARNVISSSHLVHFWSTG